MSQLICRFCLGQHAAALPIDAVQSIFNYESSTPIPKSPAGLLGMLAHHGELLFIIQLIPEPITPEHQIVLIRHSSYGLLVKGSDLIQAEESAEASSPPVELEELAEAYRGAEGIIWMLDHNLLLSAFQ
jgi:chemotaxis signal transduction protein